MRYSPDDAEETSPGIEYGSAGKKAKALQQQIDAIDDKLDNFYLISFALALEAAPAKVGEQHPTGFLRLKQRGGRIHHALESCRPMTG